MTDPQLVGFIREHVARPAGARAVIQPALGMATAASNGRPRVKRWTPRRQAQWAIRHALRNFAKERRRDHSAASWNHGYAFGVLQQALNARLISEAQFARFDRRLHRINYAEITRGRKPS